MKSQAETNRKQIEETIDGFWESIPPVWTHVRAYIRETASENYGISVEQFHILRHIRGGIDSISELAEVKNISRPAISQAVEVLVQQELITRRQSELDRRFVHLELSEKGKSLLKAVFDQTREWMADQFSDATPEEMDRLKISFSTLRKLLGDKS